MQRTRLAPVALAFAVVLCASCAKPAPVISPAEAQQLRSQALIDSGNASFRAADFANAAKRYASATVVKPDDPAAFYGLGMALAKLGRDDDARVAYARARALSGRGADGARSR